ncbi:hypothetical protein [Conexibacter sp. CPCC 206217]|uniref:hypothetical protein n=1 Tax=Conexibacter sp. CPCC 206217 TaxID=3064574 RepID=UPI00271970BF|nr:hypothetical protein [Conexibacter sp. CPCC 206217]MDO8212878.1 hypothetical protein [Conexibacter sp. CPCC 206217]
MTIDLKRVRLGEWIAGAGGVLLLLSLFLLDWYSVGGGAFFTRGSVDLSANGWHTHSVLRWFMLLTILAALILFVATLTQQTPAFSSAWAPVLTALAFVTTVFVAYRVVINEPGPNEFVDVDVGAWIGLFACALTTYGGYLSMRIEGGPIADVPVQHRTLSQ